MGSGIFTKFNSQFHTSIPVLWNGFLECLYVQLPYPFPFLASLSLSLIHFPPAISTLIESENGWMEKGCEICQERGEGNAFSRTVFSFLIQVLDLVLQLVVSAGIPGTGISREFPDF